MKQTLAFILLVVLLVTACGANNAPESADASAAGDEAAVQQGDPTVTVFRAPT